MWPEDSPSNPPSRLWLAPSPSPAQPNEARQPVSHFIPHGRRAIDREDILTGLSGDQEMSFLRYRELLPRLRTMLEKIAKDLQYCLVSPPPQRGSRATERPRKASAALF